MASLFFGLSAGLCGVGAYSSFNKFSEELKKSKNFSHELEKYTIDFSDRLHLKGKGIVRISSNNSKNYFYSICKIKIIKDIEMKQCDTFNWNTGEINSILIPTEVAHKRRKFIDKFLADPTFYGKCLPSVNSSYLFSTRPSIAICDGKYLSELLQKRHRFHTFYGENKDVFELSTFTLPNNLFLFGENIGDQFVYSCVSDNKLDLINKIVSETDNSEKYLAYGILCTGGFILSMVATIMELKTKN